MIKHVAITTLASLAFAACAKSNDAATDTTTMAASATAADGAQCTPIDTRAPAGKAQTPAFSGQYRSCKVTSDVMFDVAVITNKLDTPWAVEPLPSGDLLVTERGGKMRVVSATGTVGDEIKGIPAVDAGGQGGLLDVALSPSFATDNVIYWSFSEKQSDGTNTTAIARGVLSADRKSVSDVKVLFRVAPTYKGDKHFGSRLAFGTDGKLYASFGERSDTPMRKYAQMMDSHLGKIIRLNTDGTVPTDNPFVGQANAKPEIWTLGHRNVQAMAFDASGSLWDIEHGTNGGDELNLIQKGKNYGWADVAYGAEYSGDPLPMVTAKDGTEQPVYFWDPNIAPSGAQFHSGTGFPSWKGNLFVGGMKEKFLVRLVIENNKVTGEEHLLGDRSQRVRDVREGADGALYIVTDEKNGELWRISPRK